MSAENNAEKHYGTYKGNTANQLDEANAKGSSLALEFDSEKKNSDGKIENYKGLLYYFADKNKTIQEDSDLINLKNTYIIVYDNSQLFYHKPKSDDIQIAEVLNTLNRYDNRVIVNIKKEGDGDAEKNTHIFLKKGPSSNNELLGASISYLGSSGQKDIKVVEELFKYLDSINEVNKSLESNGGGKRKYKSDVNQKSLKKMSTIIKKLLKINLNIKQTAKPATKPKAKPVAKPKAKPVAKPTAKPKAKPVAKPKAKPTAKPKAKPKAKK